MAEIRKRNNNRLYHFCNSPLVARWILNTLYRLTEWARMSFKAKKCRSLVIKKGKSGQKFSF
jgi:hypothetical protein